MNEDEAGIVAAVAAKYAQGAVMDRWSLIMRYGRLFTPGPDAGSGPYPRRHTATIAWKTYQRAMDLGLLYAEGYVCVAGRIMEGSA